MRLVATSPTSRGTAPLEIALVVALLAGCAARTSVPASVSAENTVSEAHGVRRYATRFPLTEDPISEGGRWINGGTDGLDWTDVQTTPGMASGAPGVGFFLQGATGLNADYGLRRFRADAKRR